MHVPHGGLQIIMPKQFFNRIEVRSVIQQVGGKTMAYGMYGIVFIFQSCFYQCFLHQVLYALRTLYRLPGLYPLKRYSFGL